MYKYKWFQDFITWCRKWDWFDEYGYGKSLSLEDFCRNPFENFRESYFPFIIKDVKSYSVFNLRCGYIPAEKAPPSAQVWVVPMGDRGWKFNLGDWVLIDFRWFNPWWTKFCNAVFFLQFAVSLKYYIPIPFISLCIKIVPWYFQFGLGWGPEKQSQSGVKDCAVLCAKLRFVNEKTSNETQWNPSDVTGYEEGTI